MLRQFKLFYAGKQPVAVEFYTKASPEVAARIDAGNYRLEPAEWRSGEHTRLIERLALDSKVARFDFHSKTNN